MKKQTKKYPKLLTYSLPNCEAKQANERTKTVSAKQAPCEKSKCRYRSKLRKAHEMMIQTITVARKIRNNKTLDKRRTKSLMMITNYCVYY